MAPTLVSIVIMLLLLEQCSCQIQADTDCEVSRWLIRDRQWCSKKCGGGVIIITRTITQQPTGNGKPCPQLTMTADCNTHACPLEVEDAWLDRDCLQSTWITNDSICSKDCGGEVLTVTCSIAQQPEGNGKQCPKLQIVTNCDTCPTTTVKDLGLLIIGGYEYKYESQHDASEPTMELYNPFNATLNRDITVEMIQPRSGHATVFMDDGTVMTVGGEDRTTWTYLSHCERYYPNKNAISQCPSLSTKRSYPGLSVLNGLPYVCGGEDEQNKLKTCEYLINGSWQFSVPMNSERMGLTMATINGYLYVMGGYGPDDEILSSVERKGESADDNWSYVKSMNHKRAHHSTAVMAGKIYTCGGAVGGATCEWYDDTEDLWFDFTPMQRERKGLALVAANGYLFAIGGDSRDVERSVEMYSKQNDKWTDSSHKLTHKRRFTTAVLISS